MRSAAYGSWSGKRRECNRGRFRFGLRSQLRRSSMFAHHRLAVIASFLLIVFASPAAHAFCFGTIHVHVFSDVNGNGVLDPGEPGRPGVIVQNDQFGDGTIEGTSTTDG